MGVAGLALLCAVVGTVHVLRTTNDQDSPDATAAAAPPPVEANEAPAPAPATGDCVTDQLNKMTANQRIGQLLLLGVPATGLGRAASAAIARSAPGGVFLTGRSTAGVAATAEIADDIRAIGTKAAGGAGMFVGVDQEGGQVQVLRGPGIPNMPSAAVQGTWEPELLQEKAATWGRALRSAGVNVNLAPVADVLSPALGKDSAPLGRFDRAFGATPREVATHVAAFVKGMKSEGVATTAKHFPGLGRVRDNTDFSTDVTDPTTTATDVNLAPFVSAVEAGTDWIMISSAVYEKIDGAQPGAFSPAVLDIVRKRVGFTGVVVSDDFGNAAQVRSVHPGERAVRFIEAGGDIILTGAPSDLEPMIQALLGAAKRPEFARRLAEAERRVLQAKREMKLLPCG